MKHSFILIFLFSFVLILPAKAQMFSVGDTDRAAFNPFAPYLRVGMSNIDFTYEGQTGVAFPANRYDFSGNGLHLALESNGLNAALTLANSLTGQDDQSFFQLGLQFNNPFMIIRRPSLSVGIPLQLSTQLTTVRNDQSNDEFAQTGLSAGLGALVQLRAGRAFGITAQFIPSYGFSSSSGGFFGGNVFSLDGKARVNFYNLLFGRNISLGFDYKSNSFDIDGEELDYDLKKLTFTVGVSL